MQKDLEERLEALEQELAKAKQPAAKSASKRIRLAMPRPRMHKRWWISAAIVLAVAAITLPLYAMLNDKPAGPTAQTPSLRQIANAASFEVYFPGDLPQGFSFDPKSASLSSDILIYTIAGPNGSTLTVTEQKKPQNFDYRSIQTDTSFKTPYGTATAYEQSDKSMGSLVSETTWVVCNSSKAIGAKAMEAVLQAMQTVQ